MITLIRRPRAWDDCWTSWNPRRRPARPGTLRSRPILERLEDRALPSTFTVTDPGDSLIGSGLEGDLRYCLTQANANPDPSNRIVFQDGLTGTITLMQGELAITSDVEIDGPGADLLTISANYQSGVLNITSDPGVQQVRIADLTIADGIGILNSFGTARFGGGLLNDHAAVILTRCDFTRNVMPGQVDSGGAIDNGPHGNMTLDSCNLIDNRSGPRGDGGAITNFGSMTLSDCTISGNHASTWAAFGSGGTMTLARCTVSGNISEETTAGEVIANFGGRRMMITDSTISDNSSWGPAIQNTGSQLILTDSTIADNAGGALSNVGGSIALTGCTISGNVGTLGAALEALSAVGSDTNMTNCTITGNSSPLRGAIDLFSAAESLELTSCTITGNTGGLTGGLFVFSNSVASARAVVRNTIIAGNQGSSGADVWGPVISLGYNLIAQNDHGTGWNARDQTGTSDQPLDPQIGPLDDNGGPTRTHALYAGSPALVRGDPSLSGAPDQRGTTRGDPITRPDIGAFNTSPTLKYTIIAPDTVVQGEAFQVIVIALDNYGNRASTSARTIHFSSTDGAAALPGDYQFVRNDLGAHTFTVTLNTPGLQSLRVVDTQAELFIGIVNIDVQSD